MRKILPSLLLLSLLCGLMLLRSPQPVSSAPPPTPMIARAVIGGGGGISIQGDLQIHTTIGQPIIGSQGDASAQYDLCAGFWCAVAIRFYTFLPSISR